VVELAQTRVRPPHAAGLVRMASAIGLHYDKGELLAERFEMGRTPALSTVTYLTGRGGTPTVVFDWRHNDAAGEERHLAFHGGCCTVRPRIPPSRRLGGRRVCG